MVKILAVAMLLSTAAAAAEYPPGLFEHSPELSCDMQHQCYHMDPAHPDKVTPPPAPQYPRHTDAPPAPSTPPLEETPLASGETPRAPSLALPDDPYDPQSCFNLRRGLFPTPQAAANARRLCH